MGNEVVVCFKPTVEEEEEAVVPVAVEVVQEGREED